MKFFTAFSIFAAAAFASENYAGEEGAEFRDLGRKKRAFIAVPVPVIPTKAKPFPAFAPQLPIISKGQPLPPSKGKQLTPPHVSKVTYVPAAPSKGFVAQPSKPVSLPVRIPSKKGSIQAAPAIHAGGKGLSGPFVRSQQFNGKH